MANPTTEKYQQNSVRSERQIRPIFNSIIFLLAANLVAKGALGLSTYQTPNIPNGIQGSLYLTLNGPQGPTQRPTSSEPFVSYQPVWLPIQTNVPLANVETTTKRPVLPITQQQIVNILDPFLDNTDRYENEDIDDVPQQHVVINKFNRIDDKTGQIQRKDKQDRQLKESEMDEPNVTEQPDQIEEFDSDEVLSKTNISDSDETGRQQVTPSTTMPTTTRNMTAVTATIATNATIYNATVDYGPSNGYENISFTVAPPTANANTTGNVSQALQPPAGGSNTTVPPPSNNAGVYNYYPNADYGPYTGNENISITYGPPVYQKPFFSSPEDTFLNSQNQQYYENYPTTFYNQFPDYYKYNGILNRFYNNYNNPSYYGNYLDKQIF